MYWVLQENMFREAEWENLVGCLERWKFPYSVHKIVPIEGRLIPELGPVDGKIICMGAYSVRHTAKRMGWNPGVYDLDGINFVEQRKHWGEHMLNYDAVVLPFKEMVLTEDDIFVRPIEDSKHFSGQVFYAEKFNEWRKGICESGDDYGNGLNPNTLLMMSSPKKIYSEYRYWIINGRISTRSQYKLGHRVIYSPKVDPRIDDYVSEILHLGVLWLPKAFVLDVCETPNGMRIVEINTINSAGFYAGDVQQLVHDLERLES